MKMKVICRKMSMSLLLWMWSAYFHAILKLGYQGIVGDEGEQLPLHGVW